MLDAGKLITAARICAWVAPANSPSPPRPSCSPCYAYRAAGLRAASIRGSRSSKIFARSQVRAGRYVVCRTEPHGAVPCRRSRNHGRWHRRRSEPRSRRRSGWRTIDPSLPHSAPRYDVGPDDPGSRSAPRQCARERFRWSPTENSKAPARSTVQSLDVSTMLHGGVPMFPPTCTGIPLDLRMCPVIAVVVVLPFEPVMPMILPRRNQLASSRSPMTRTPFLR